MFKTQNLYQNDEKWKNVSLGNSAETIGGWGCLLTSVTMVLNGFGYNETPETVNEKMKAKGGFQGACFVPSMVPYIWPNVVYRDMKSYENIPAPIAEIDAAVLAGKPVIVEVDWNKQAGVQTHFVLIKEKKGNDYVIYDPYKYSGDGPDKEVLLTARYKYNGARLDTEIYAALWLDSLGAPPAELPKPTKIPTPADKFTLYATEDNLALRADASVSGALLKRLTRGTELISLEPKVTATAKLGVNGKWINVQDPGGAQGYVAAWYLSDSKNGTPPSGSTPASPASTSPASSTNDLPPGALAFYPTEELSFRSQPVISPTTLIRRIPATEKIVSVEPANVVIPKVGVVNQWLKVRDASNREGYVAAWYVKYAGGSMAQQTDATSPSTSGEVKVKIAAQAVAFRNQPLVSDSSLIRWLPLGTELTIAEPGGESKIGANNQWLKVKDAGGMEGFVAAWFVSR
ncbi:MAG: C39 family peptidase [Anaerolineales bacterium]|nr:MAG: C39 family peptidase [Anaerolineales bacterium]